MPSSLGSSSPRRISGAFKIPGILLTPSQHNSPISTNCIGSTTYSDPAGLFLGSTFQSQAVTVRESGTAVSRSTMLRVISGLRCEVDEICVLLGSYVAYSGNSLPTFRNNLSNLQGSRNPNNHIGFFDP
jgi:hypothetical protein